MQIRVELIGKGLQYPCKNAIPLSQDDILEHSFSLCNTIVQSTVQNCLWDSTRGNKIDLKDGACELK